MWNPSTWTHVEVFMGLCVPPRYSRLVLALLSALFTILLLFPAIFAGEPQKPAEKTAETRKAPPPGAVEVHMNDGTSVQFTLREEAIPLCTPYGKLLVPIMHIHRIEFATRVSSEDARRVRAAIANLGNAQFRVREEASTELVSLREKGYAALLESAKEKDPEVIRRAELVLQKIRETVPEEQLEFRKHDLIYTADSKFAGRIEATTLLARTPQSAEVQLKLADMHSMLFLSVEDALEIANAVPDPGDLTKLPNLTSEPGKRMAFKVTGSLTGQVWGTDVYTADSSLAAVAVHAGVVRPGQTGVLRLVILGPHPTYKGSTRNGVTSLAYGHYQGFQVLR